MKKNIHANASDNWMGTIRTEHKWDLGWVCTQPYTPPLHSKLERLLPRLETVNYIYNSQGSKTTNESIINLIWIGVMQLTNCLPPQR